MGLEFDEDAAWGLVGAADKVADRLFWEGSARRLAAEIAHVDFQGPFQQTFTNLCLMESENRASLRNVLLDVIEDTKNAILAAEKERERLAQCAVWEERSSEYEPDTLFDMFGVRPGDLDFPVPRPSCGHRFSRITGNGQR